MKPTYFLFLLITSFGFAQIPSGYYDYATGAGYVLKTQLKKIIDDQDDIEINNTIEALHNVQTYNALDNFNATYERDNYYDINGNTTILDIYSENPGGADAYNFTPTIDECGNYSAEGDCYNKEHIIPQSVFSSQAPMHSDAHHLLPTDGRVNGFRSSYPFGRVNDAQLVSQNGITNPTSNGSKLGNNLNSGYSVGYSGIVFEPIDEFKGDIARIYFYFVTRYENQINNWSAYEMFDGSTDKVLADPFLSILMTWHVNDPVSQKEIDRNNNIYYNHQNNRNPFIDHPEFVELIWSNTIDTQAPTEPTNLVASNPTNTSIDLSWSSSTDNIAVSLYEIYRNGVFTNSTNTTSITITELTANTNYCFTVKAKDAANNTSGFSNQVCETTRDNSNTANNIDLFFSEYMEGSGTNKALEIANFTGANVSLSNYTLKLNSNGNSTWSYVYNFPNNSSINNQNVFVIANSGLNTMCQSEQDDINNSIINFSGNDAIGLFKDDALIDIIGTFQNGNTFAQNVTLIRKQNITTPTITFNSDEWDTALLDDCSNLGLHSQILSSDTFKLANLEIYPNPLKGDYLNIKTNHHILNVTFFNVLGKPIFKQKIDSSNSKINIGFLNKGMYFIKFSYKDASITKKFIKQ